ncbi:MAG: DUF4157 domain-containing protein [Moorea sp. SIO2I5]|nr:DUF4157 domain-containing protein [Moorena sp. SIO2I5]
MQGKVPPWVVGEEKVVNAQTMGRHGLVQQHRSKGMPYAPRDGGKSVGETPVQRMEEEKKAENKTGLPDRLKEGIERMSGYDLSGVRVNYNSRKPAQINAHAYTQGKAIEVAPGQERHLHHEAWHVVQQMQGRVRSTKEVNGVGVNDDRGLEREADVMGQRAVQRTSIRTREGTDNPKNISEVIQCYLIVGNFDYTRWYKEQVLNNSTIADDQKDHELNKTITQIAKNMLAELQYQPRYTDVRESIIKDENGKIRAQIKKWIEDKVGDKTVSKNQLFGRKNQTRVYKNYTDLAIALTGWVRAKPKRKEEKHFAEDVQKNERISYNLDTVLHKIKAWIDNHPDKDYIKNHLKNGQPIIINKKRYEWNIYQDYFRKANKGKSTLLPTNYIDVLVNPENYDVRIKSGILSDLMHFFYEYERIMEDKLKKLPNRNLLAGMPTSKATEINPKTQAGIRREYKRPENAQIRGVRDSKGLVKKENLLGGTDPKVKVSAEEEHPTYKYARLKNLPMYGRHSHSAERMMTMVKGAGGTTEEIETMAYAMISYWRLNYDHTSIPYHTLHEVMDFAPEFGIDYNPEERFKGFEKYQNRDNFMNMLLNEVNIKEDKRAFEKLKSMEEPKELVPVLLRHYEQLYKSQLVTNYLRETRLEDADFFSLNQTHLARFFMKNLDLVDLLPEDRNKYVITIIQEEKGKEKTKNQGKNKTKVKRIPRKK